jgi:flagellar protein FlgJ
MLDVEMARASSGGLNLGIADAMVEQLGRGLPKEVK